MGPLLRSLIHLQQIEIKLRNTRAMLRKSQKAVQRQEHLLSQHQAALAAKREEIKMTRMRADHLELDLKTEETEIAKLRVALNTAKTNKDYSAILTRLNTDKADKTKLEDQILQLMNQIEADQLACKEIEAEIGQDQQKLEEIAAASRKKQADIQAQIDDLEEQFSQAAAEVPEKERQMFQRLANHFDGEVLAEVKETPRKSEHNCGGCYMSIPLELVNSLMTRDEVVVCHSCGRILVLDVHESQPTA